MPRPAAVLIGPCRLFASAKMAMPFGFSAIAWLKPDTQLAGLPLPSITLSFQPRCSAACFMYRPYSREMSFCSSPER